MTQNIMREAFGALVLVDDKTDAALLRNCDMLGVFLADVLGHTFASAITYNGLKLLYIEGAEARSGTAPVAGIGNTAGVGRKAAQGIVDAIVGQGATAAEIRKTALVAAAVTGIGATAAEGEVGAEAHEGSAVVAGVGATGASGRKSNLLSAAINAVCDTAAAGAKQAEYLLLAAGVGESVAAGGKATSTTVAVVGADDIVAGGAKRAEYLLLAAGVGESTAAGRKAAATTVAIAGIGDTVADVIKRAECLLLAAGVAESAVLSRKTGFNIAEIVGVGFADAVGGAGETCAGSAVIEGLARTSAVGLAGRRSTVAINGWAMLLARSGSLAFRPAWAAYSNAHIGLL